MMKLDLTVTRSTPRARRRSTGLATTFLAILLCAAGLGGGATPGVAADEPNPTATAAPSVPRLPVIAAQGPPARLEGKILRSTRGRKGPVRLLVERKGGGEVTVLVAPDEFCERAGLSLRVGEMVDMTGAMLKGERPIMIASSVTVDGKTVQVRDEQGKVIESAESAAGSPSPGASTKEGKAMVGGGKPASPPAH